MTRLFLLALCASVTLLIISCTSKNDDSIIYYEPSYRIYMNVMNDSVDISGTYSYVNGMGKDSQKLTHQLTYFTDDDSMYFLPFDLNADSVTYILNDKRGIKDTFTLIYSRELNVNHLFYIQMDSVRIGYLSERFKRASSKVNGFYEFMLTLDRK